MKQVQQAGTGHLSHRAERQGSQTRRRANQSVFYKDVALPAFDMLVRIKATDPGGFLNRFDADVASMIAALGWAFLPTRSRSASRKVGSLRNQLHFRRKRRKWENTVWKAQEVG